jgi:O-antigen ligase
MRAGQTRTLMQSLAHVCHLLWFTFLAITILCLPFHKVFPVFPLLLSGITGLIAAALNNPLPYLRANWRVLVSMLLYLAPLYAWYISADKATAALDLQVKFSLWAIPFIVALNKPISSRQMIWLLRIFVLACLIFVMTALMIAAWSWPTEGAGGFGYKKLVDFTAIHPSYVGMYINFAILILLADILHVPKGMHWLPSKWSLAMVLLLFIFLLLLTSKNAMLLAILMLPGAAWWYARKTGNLKRVMGIAAILTLVFSLFILLHPTTRERFTMLYRYDDVAYDNSVSSRQLTWQAAWQLISEEGWTGVGSGDSQKALNAHYEAIGYKQGVAENHNAHNQYLQIIIEGGCIAACIFLSSFIFYIWSAKKMKQAVYLGFLLIFLGSISTEAMLEVQSGVIFFVLFNALFLSQSPIKT